MPKNKTYKKLQGTEYFSSNKLYIGPDHLFSSKSNFFSDEYHRFYYKDIQAIITRKTITGKILNLLSIFLLILFSVLAFLLSGAGAAFFFSFSAIFFIFLIVNLIKGPTSICHIQTPVQTARLSALTRKRGTEKAIGQLKPLMENSQGPMIRENIRNASQNDYSEASSNKDVMSLIHVDGRYHMALFSILTASALLIILEMFVSNFFLSFFSGIVNLGIATILIISLRKQTRSDIYGSIKTMTWSIVGYLGLRYLLGYILLMVVTLKNPEIAYIQWELIKKVAAISPHKYSWLMALYFLYLFFTVGIGITGLISTVLFRKKHGLKQSFVPDNKTINQETGHE